MERIAQGLLERETLDGQEVNRILIEETGIDHFDRKEQKPHVDEPPPVALTPAPPQPEAPGGIQTPLPSPGPA